MHALIGQDGWVLIDAGMGTTDARAAFQAGLTRAGLEVKNLKAIVLTHHHPDHIGLSGELYAQSGAKVYMHPIDEASVQLIYSGTMPERFGRVSHFFTQHGLPHTSLWLNNINQQEARIILGVPPHEAFTLVEDGDILDLLGEHYRVLWTPGHSDGQICLFRERDGIFLAADHVLPRITPNIGLYSEKDRPNPLDDYLHSLEKVSHLPASIVLPGHGEPFIGLSERTQEIIDHHYHRESLLRDMLKDGPQNAYQLTQRLFNDRLKSDETKRMAMAEVLAHLEHMRFNGQVKQQHPTDDSIVYALA
jgi:glyoxylase-like metal-dependent hydrolase (beta-lactamase superfamily II)